MTQYLSSHHCLCSLETLGTLFTGPHWNGKRTCLIKLFLRVASKKIRRLELLETGLLYSINKKVHHLYLLRVAETSFRLATLLYALNGSSWCSRLCFLRSSCRNYPQIIERYQNRGLFWICRVDKCLLFF